MTQKLLHLIQKIGNFVHVSKGGNLTEKDVMLRLKRQSNMCFIEVLLCLPLRQCV